MPTLNPKATISSLDRLMAEHAAGVFRFLRSLVRDEDSARDLLQDTFLKLRCQADGAGKPLVFTVARNCALDHLKKAKARSRRESESLERAVESVASTRGSSPDARLEDRQFREDLLAGLASIPEEQRTVFHLSEIEGVGYKDIARILGVSQGTIASRKHHAVMKLREYLGRRGHET